MVWGKEDKKKVDEKDPTATERDVLVYNINETANETLESTRFNLSRQNIHYMRTNSCISKSNCVNFRFFQIFYTFCDFLFTPDSKQTNRLFKT